jgi:hypothetical protein
MPAVRHLGLFPFCILPEGTNSPDARLPMTLKDALSYWWRVKRWRVATAIIDGSAGILPTGDMSLSYSYDDETGLVCPVSRVPTIASDPFSILLAINVYAEKSGELVKVAAQILANNGGATILLADGGNEPGLELANPVGTCTLAMGASEYAFTLFGNEFTTDAEIRIEASEWWPYDPGDGLGPIYDTATGRQLRAFP